MGKISEKEDFRDTADSLNIMLTISHSWLKDLFLELLIGAEIKVVVVESINRLLQELDESTDILIVDAADYQGHYHQLFEQLRQKSPSLGILALLSTATVGYRDSILLAGANGVVVKEEAHRELIPVLMQILNGCQINRHSSCLLSDLGDKFNAFIQGEVKEVEKRTEDSNVLFSRRFNRRTFLKGSAIAAGAAGIAVADPGGAMKALAESTEEAAMTATEEKIFTGACRANCQNLCRLNIHVRDGKVVRTSMAPMPNPEYNRICIKGLTHVQRIYDPDRLKYPMKRVGERGAGEWERISWDEAATMITDKWKELQSTYGPRSVASSTQSANYAMVNGASGITNRLFNLMESTHFTPPIDINMVYGFFRTIGWFSMFWNANEHTTMKYARNVFVWGANPTESQTQVWHFVQEAKNNGAKLTVIDPMFTISASKADQFIPVRPGSDTAMVLAMAKLIIDENWIDKSFVKQHTVAPFLVKDNDGKFLRMKDIMGATAVDGSGAQYKYGNEDAREYSAENDAMNEFVVWDSKAGTYGRLSEVSDPEILGSFTINGIAVKTALTLLKNQVEEYTPEYAEEITTVKADVIRELARTYALDGPCTIYTLFGPDRYYNGHYFAHALAAIAALTGNIGKLGASIGIDTLWDYIPGAPANVVDGKKVNPVFAEQVPRIFETGMHKGEKYPIKALYTFCHNILGNWPEQNVWINKIFKDLELIVIADSRMTDTARYADIVLPVAHWFEVEDVGSFGNHPHMIFQEKAIEPLYECKSDSEITRLLADKMGLGEYFQFTDMDYLNEIFSKNKDAIENNITVERLKREKVVRHVKQDPLIYGEGGKFNTPTGRIEFYVESPIPFCDLEPEFDPSTEHLPQFTPPIEAWPDNPLYQKYPLVMIQEHKRWRAHTQWSHVPALRELDPEPTVIMCPEDAELRGIKKGDKVKVFNDRGSVVLRAVLSNGLPKGVINVPRGWQRDQHIAGGYQELTHNKYHPASMNIAFFDILVQMEKM